jgi:DNA-binding response OmpR family regulator
MNDTARRNILILEPERDIGELFARSLETRRDCKCYMASTEQEATDLLRDIFFELILLDMGMALLGDFRILKRLKHLSPCSVIVIDAYLHQKHHITRAISLGASDYIIKPIKVDLFRKKMEEFYVGNAC